LKERAARMVAEIRADHESEWPTMTRVAHPLLEAAHYAHDSLTPLAEISHQ
jgi:hypothetical protein